MIPWERLRPRYKWLWHMVPLLLAALNGWQWYSHKVSNNPVLAGIDLAFVVMCVAAFLYGLRS